MLLSLPLSPPCAFLLMAPPQLREGDKVTISKGINIFSHPAYGALGGADGLVLVWVPGHAQGGLHTASFMSRGGPGG